MRAKGLMLASKRLMSIKLQGLLQWCFSTIILSPSSHKLLMRSTNRQNRLQHTQSPSIPSLAKVKTWTHGLEEEAYEEIEEEAQKDETEI
ncbi:hypothetical protein H5410_039332 [Solanum commersonii]|uniref:Uncharacterized protein n=1 Tax=Solanum commersonii TaxID=4109 RepID=A0A9J5YFS1_SOLCO|nr:hypothetical protein H5410_039332 [Solanum commersonii]